VVDVDLGHAPNQRQQRGQGERHGEHGDIAVLHLFGAAFWQDKTSMHGENPLPRCASRVVLKVAGGRDEHGT